MPEIAEVIAVMANPNKAHKAACAALALVVDRRIPRLNCARDHARRRSLTGKQAEAGFIFLY